MRAGAQSDQVLAEERRLFESDAGLSYPEWQVPYRAALLDTDATQLLKQVEVAQAAVLTRLHALQGETDHHADLQMIKREKLGFLE